MQTEAHSRYMYIVQRYRDHGLDVALSCRRTLQTILEERVFGENLN